MDGDEIMAHPKKLIQSLTKEKKILQACLSYALEQSNGTISMHMNYKPKGIVIQPPDEFDNILVEVKEEEKDE